ncbi:hypothetical protein LG329_14420 [Virgibacillus necropolis]|uniref:hypothetical protein n=1 Tax=Virgibacillus necropolis TaxID=163877 RepID=UPI00384F0603
MDIAFAIVPLLIYLMLLAITVFVLYLVIQAAVRNGINTSIVGKRMLEKKDDNPKFK